MADAIDGAMKKPELRFWQIWNLSFGFFGIQMAFALQGANVSRIFQTLGANIDDIAILWIAGPVTGLLVQPLVGHFSDRTWGPLGRRRPYFLAGAILASIALVAMPNVSALWAAAVMLWLLDASINLSMEPFRAFVGDMLPSRQRTTGFAMQTVFIGGGAFLASLAPWFLAEVIGVSNTAPAGVIPDSVRFAFYGGAICLLLAIGWTIIKTPEYSPEELASFDETASVHASGAVVQVAQRPAGFFAKWGAILLAVSAGGAATIAALSADRQLYVLAGMLGLAGLLFVVNAVQQRAPGPDTLINTVLQDLVAMPRIMRQLAVVQFFSWFGLFILWVYATPAVTSRHFGTTDPTSLAYNEGANWVGWLFAIYNAIAAIYAFTLPPLAGRMRPQVLHAINLILGGLGLASIAWFSAPMWLIVSMIGVGIAWASILTIPYAMLTDALPAGKFGIYMGIFNFFIVLPQLIVSGVMGPILRELLAGQAVLTMLVGGGTMVVAAVASLSISFDKVGTNSGSDGF
jgi:maltose/moltooligosaccharide transporter